MLLPFKPKRALTRQDSRDGDTQQPGWSWCFK